LVQRNENLIRVLNYIDQNISENITAEELSQVSGYSFYHFCHLFTNLSGESISAYLRHRRLQLASDRLLEGRSVTDTAFSCGFDTPSGFAKAFRKLYQISPTEYKTMRRDRKAVPAIRKLDAFSVVGYCLPPPAGEFRAIDSGAYWLLYDFSSVSKDEYERICMPDHGEIGMWIYPDKQSGDPYYFFGPIVANKDVIPHSMHAMDIPAAEYAVFPVQKEATRLRLRDNVRRTWKYIFTEWLDRQDFSFDEEKLPFEYYCRSETWIYVPVIRSAAGSGGRPEAPQSGSASAKKSPVI